MSKCDYRFTVGAGVFESDGVSAASSSDAGPLLSVAASGAGLPADVSSDAGIVSRSLLNFFRLGVLDLVGVCCPLTKLNVRDKNM